MNSAWRLAACAALVGSSVAQSPREKALLLPSEIHLSGVVTDSGGRPLADVWIDHSGTSGKTDSEGRFDIRTRAPAVVFRSRGFQSKYYRLTGDVTLAVALDGPTSPLQQCGACTNCVPLEGSRGVLCLPRVRGVHVSALGNDIDYGKRWFWIKTRTGKKTGIQHAAGGMWGSGLPFDEDVWSAREYRETDYRDASGLRVIDARGKNADGTCWRMLGKFGETASYRNVPAEDTPLLDEVLDGATVRPVQAK